MLWTLLAFALLLPVSAAADMWRWRDASGGFHYSNVATRVPAHAVEVRTDVGYVSAAPGERRAESRPVLSTRTVERLRAERALRRRLAEIEGYYASVRRRQRLRLEAWWPNSTILPDWMVTDRWSEMKNEEAKVRAGLAALARGDRS